MDDYDKLKAQKDAIIARETAAIRKTFREEMRQELYAIIEKQKAAAETEIFDLDYTPTSGAIWAIENIEEAIAVL